MLTAIYISIPQNIDKINILSILSPSFNETILDAVSLALENLVRRISLADKNVPTKFPNNVKISS